MDEHAAYEARWTWRDRLRMKLFPEAPWPRRDDDKRTYVSTRIYVHVDWWDRLRMLWSGRLLVKVTTYTDVLVNDAESISAISVPGR
jgi:hypothetical protein